MRFLVFIWLKPEMKAKLRVYENQVRPTLESHGGRFLNIWTPSTQKSIVLGVMEGVSEIHELEFPSWEAFLSFKEDQGLNRFSEFRQEAVEKVVFLPVEAVDIKSYFQRK